MLWEAENGAGGTGAGALSIARGPARPGAHVDRQACEQLRTLPIEPSRTALAASSMVCLLPARKRRENLARTQGQGEGGT